MQLLRKLLFPFSVLYDGVTRARNCAFDNGLLKQTSFNIPVISVGNLSTGGTGKTPMIEWLIEHFSDQKIGVLSRGYGRTTSGYLEINTEHTANEVGDEPLQMKLKFKNRIVSAVCEKRVDGINNLLETHDLDLILLDDAFQHRYVKASHYILLTSYDQPFYDDYVLPTGNLRESSRGASRADTIVVTKCPLVLSQAEMEKIKEKINPDSHQKIFFSTITYGDMIVNKFTSVSLHELQQNQITVVTGIAKPAPFIDFLKQYFKVEHLKFNDHHRFRESEIQTISKKDMVITTEKDFTRLESYNLKNVFYLEMKMKFLGEAPSL